MGGNGCKLLPPAPDEGASMDTCSAPPDCAARLDDKLLWMIDTIMSTGAAAGCAYCDDGGGWPVPLLVVLSPGVAAAAGNGAKACQAGGKGAGHVSGIEHRRRPGRHVYTYNVVQRCVW